MNEKIKKNYFLIISILLIAYFVINLLNGERGLFSYIKKKNDLNKLIDQELILKKKNMDLDLKITLLNDKIDLDFIEILLRDKFIYGKRGDKIYIIKDNES
tara:strand:+ start:678 stop:980 length:303 start_codon:yes stop_codon:yes gene_type:complete